MMLTQVLLSSVILLATAGNTATLDTEIEDLSPTLRLDLTASPNRVFPGQSIELTVTLANTGRAPVVVLPAHLLARLDQGVEPRCGNQLGSFGGSIAEGGLAPTERDMAMLKPGQQITRKRSVPAPEIAGCVAGGTVVLGAEYCMFYDITLDGMSGLKGCVASNKVAVVLEAGGTGR